MKQKAEVGNFHKVLIDGKGKFEGQMGGLTDTFKRAIFDSPEL